MAARSSLDAYFLLSDRRTTIVREFRGAVTTFLTMAYILFVNPQILSAAGVPANSATACTALAAGVCCLLMGFYANLPIATASGMGLNAVVAFQIAKAAGSWQAAMGLIVLDGGVMLLLVLAGLREAVMNAIPRDLRLATGAGIGLFIAFIGLVNARIVLLNLPEAPLRPGTLHDRGTVVACVGLILTAVLMARRIPAALIIGIAASTLLALANGVAHVPGHISLPGFHQTFEAAFQADVPAAVRGCLHGPLLPLLFAVLMVDFFDTLGTATAIAEQAGLVDEQGRVINIRRVLIVDSLAAMVGGALGVSSVTAYIESAAGVAEGARTGLHSVFVGILFLLAILLAPLAGIVPGEATAPALILVGFLMMAQLVRIDLKQLDTAIPAFITLLTIPLTFSIAHGIGFGFITFTAIKILTLRFRDVKPLMYVVSAAFAVYFLS